MIISLRRFRPPKPQPTICECLFTGNKTGSRRFYKALEAVSAKNPDEAEEMVKEIVKICLADGQLHYNEKLYLAEIFQTLREQGVEPEVGL